MKTILCFGDSNTYGYIPAVGGRYDETIRWTGVLSEMLADKDCLVIEAGQNGRTTVFDDPVDPGRNGSKVLPGLLKQYPHTDCVMVMLGTNDCKVRFFADAKAIACGMEKLLQQLRAYDSGMRIVLISPVPMTEPATEDGSFDAESLVKSGQLAPLYRELAERYRCRFLDAAEVAAVSPADGVHFDPAAHRQLAQALAELFLAEM